MPIRSKAMNAARFRMVFAPAAASMNQRSRRGRERSRAGRMPRTASCKPM